eukprot:gene23054-biopygen19298
MRDSFESTCLDRVSANWTSRFELQGVPRYRRWKPGPTSRPIRPIRAPGPRAAWADARRDTRICAPGCTPENPIFPTPPPPHEIRGTPNPGNTREHYTRGPPGLRVYAGVTPVSYSHFCSCHAGVTPGLRRGLDGPPDEMTVSQADLDGVCNLWSFMAALCKPCGAGTARRSENWLFLQICRFLYRAAKSPGDFLWDAFSLGFLWNPQANIAPARGCFIGPQRIELPDIFIGPQRHLFGTSCCTFHCRARCARYCRAPRPCTGSSPRSPLNGACCAPGARRVCARCVKV